MEKTQRLIDANALDALENLDYDYAPVRDGCAWYRAADVWACIESKPTVDAVEVVRCKNCKHCELCYPEKQIGKEATPGWYCKDQKKYRRPDDFCSYGERRTDNGC